MRLDAMTIHAWVRQAGLRPQPTAEQRGFIHYTLFAALVTALGYSLGYSTIGFGLLLLGAMAALVRFGRPPWIRTPLDLPLAVFAAVLIASAIVSPYHRVAIAVTLMLLVSGSVYFGAFAWLLAVMPEARGRLLRAWAAGAALAAAVGLAYGTVNRVMGHADTVQGRAEIPRGVGPNGLGTTLMLGAVLSLGLAIRNGGRERLLWGVTAVLCVAGLLASGSRASLAGWVVGTAYVVWRELRARPWRMATLAGAGLLVVSGLAAASPQLMSRLPSTVRDVNGNRVHIWRTSLEMIADRPLLGSGFGTFERAYGQRRAPGMSPEPFAFNLWFNLAVETGLLGVTAGLWVVVAAIAAWVRATPAPRLLVSLHGAIADLWRPTIAAMWIGLLVDQLADNTLFSISTSAAVWLLLALTVVPVRGVRMTGETHGAARSHGGSRGA
jgi:O-antigen ligase